MHAVGLPRTADRAAEDHEEIPGPASHGLPELPQCHTSFKDGPYGCRYSDWDREPGFSGPRCDIHQHAICQGLGTSIDRDEVALFSEVGTVAVIRHVMGSFAQSNALVA